MKCYKLFLGVWGLIYLFEVFSIMFYDKFFFLVIEKFIFVLVVYILGNGIIFYLIV